MMATVVIKWMYDKEWKTRLLYGIKIRKAHILLRLIKCYSLEIRIFTHSIKIMNEKSC